MVDVFRTFFRLQLFRSFQVSLIEATPSVAAARAATAWPPPAPCILAAAWVAWAAVPVAAAAWDWAADTMAAAAAMDSVVGTPIRPRRTRSRWSSIASRCWARRAWASRLWFHSSAPRTASMRTTDLVSIRGLCRDSGHKFRFTFLQNATRPSRTSPLY